MYTLVVQTEETFYQLTEIQKEEAAVLTVQMWQLQLTGLTPQRNNYPIAAKFTIDTFQ